MDDLAKKVKCGSGWEIQPLGVIVDTSVDADTIIEALAQARQQALEEVREVINDQSLDRGDKLDDISILIDSLIKGGDSD